MRKVMVLIGVLSLLLLTGCVTTNDDEYSDERNIVYLLNVNLVFQEYIWVESDGVMEYLPGNIEDVSGVYDIDSIEMLISDYGAFPFKSILIEDEVEELIILVQSILDDLSNEQSIGGTLPSMGMKEKLSIELTRNGNILSIDFYQDENEEIVSMKVSYNDNETLFEGMFGDEYNSFYLQLDSIIQNFDHE